MPTFDVGERPILNRAAAGAAVAYDQPAGWVERSETHRCIAREKNWVSQELNPSYTLRQLACPVGRAISAA
jgi:hypothetical protein